MRDISAVIDLALAHNPQLSTASFYDVQRWLAEGCTVEDVMPALRATIQKFAMQQKPPLRSLKYIEGQVYEARDRRVREQASRDPVSADLRRARAIAIRRSCGLYDPTDLRWLEGYEAKQGKVTV